MKAGLGLCALGMIAAYWAGAALAQDHADRTPPALPHVEAAMSALVEAGELPGAVTIAYRDGELVHASAIGVQDLATGEPAQLDTIFRAFSMTKPVTAVAMMILYDEGLWSPDDPVAKFLPELSDLQVITGVDADGEPVLAPAETQPTMGQLMTHTAGFSYGFTAEPVDRLYNESALGAADSNEDYVAALAALPLAYQPGTEWRYSVSMDVQGAIIERLTGQTLPEFMEERIFAPLGMADTGFHVPADKRGRFAALYSWADGALAPLSGGQFGSDYAVPPGFASGGGGLVSTAPDYARIGLMLLNGGALDGARILSPDSARAIMTNHIPQAIVEGGFGIGFQQIRPGYQYGYNGVVVTAPEAAGVALGEGSYLWDGAAGTYFWADPENDVVFVGMVQRLMSAGGFPQIQDISQKAVAEDLGL